MRASKTVEILDCKYQIRPWRIIDRKNYMEWQVELEKDIVGLLVKTVQAFSLTEHGEPLFKTMADAWEGDTLVVETLFDEIIGFNKPLSKQKVEDAKKNSGTTDTSTSN